MDTSETYIKMCEKAEEIQLLSPLSNVARWIDLGSWYAEGIEEGDILCFGSIGADWEWYKQHHQKELKKLIWLPRQDQLQEMVHPSDCTYAISYCLLDNFIYWYQARCYSELARIYSMEQLWLAYVMKEKNKVWNGEDWVIKELGKEEK